MKRTVRVIGVPMDLGQSRRGVDLGPGAVRYAGLDARLRQLGHPLEDIGNLSVPVRDALDASGGLQFLPAVRDVCAVLYDEARRAMEEDRLPIFLGGDHSIALGSIGGITHGGRCGVIWVDAHGDFNIPETSPSGNIHGMPLAALTGRGAPELVDLGRPGPKLPPEDVVLIGLRDIDHEEGRLIRESGITAYTMRDLDERGIGAIAREALLKLGHLDRIHVSLDLDGLDPREAPGVGTPVPGGITYREAHLLMEILADSGRVASLDLVEINPILDARNQTADLAVELAASLLGQNIL